MSRPAHRDGASRAPVEPTSGHSYRSTSVRPARGARPIVAPAAFGPHPASPAAKKAAARRAASLIDELVEESIDRVRTEVRALAASGVPVTAGVVFRAIARRTLTPDALEKIEADADERAAEEGDDDGDEG